MNNDKVIELIDSLIAGQEMQKEILQGILDTLIEYQEFLINESMKELS